MGSAGDRGRAGGRAKARAGMRGGAAEESGNWSVERRLHRRCRQEGGGCADVCEGAHEEADGIDWRPGQSRRRGRGESRHGRRRN